jgi:hypothetical protein
MPASGAQFSATHFFCAAMFCIGQILIKSARKPALFPVAFSLRMAYILLPLRAAHCECVPASGLLVPIFYPSGE